MTHIRILEESFAAIEANNGRPLLLLHPDCVSACSPCGSPIVFKGIKFYMNECMPRGTLYVMDERRLDLCGLEAHRKAVASWPDIARELDQMIRGGKPDEV